ncbi:MAG TPA: hypothetical protein VH092_37465 [Urbifossiella sp.]|jgi:hypothetical protein|nr:hypothetical protein [Urbifossiella sp.]
MLGWHRAWPVVLAINLYIPVTLGWEVTRDTGHCGLLAAVVLIWTVGHLLIARVPGVGLPLVIGGVVTAAAQFFPVLQIMAGLTSLRVVDSATGSPSGWQGPSEMTEAKAFVATVLTATQVAAVALVCGAVVRAVWTRAKGGPV